jgi:TolA-binding protein
MKSVMLSLAVAVAGITAASAQSAQQAEELARRHYELGLGFMETQKYSEALKDFQMVADSYPLSSVAGDALVQIAQYHLEIARDPAAAQSTTDAILKRYSASEAAALAYVLNGRIAIERGPTPSAVDTALASFGRVPGLFPGSEAIPQAIYYSGEALRLARRYEEALERYRDLPMKYPASIWTARALVRSAFCLVQAGQSAGAPGAPGAIEGLQRVRAQFPGTPEAAAALNLNTVLYRLYIRPPAQPPYVFSDRAVGGPTDRLSDVAAIAVDPQDNVLVAHENAVAVFDRKGALVKSIRADNPSSVTFRPPVGPVVVRKDSLITEAGQTTVLGVPQQDGRLKPVEDIPAALVTSRGEWLVSDKNNKAVLVFTDAGRFVKPFVAGAADRLAINAVDDVAVLDRDAKQVSVFDRDGKPLVRILARGTGYELENPVDIAFDALGHLYVLERNRGAVYVFNPQWKLVTGFSAPERTPGAFQRAVAFGLDSAARLYIFDDRTQRLQVYQ